uniref:Fiber protein Fb34 n=1 Tax=Allium sativum TaxID=4682 RepID=H2CLX8_ALLSA|nr:unknown [Allium sativum]
MGVSLPLVAVICSLHIMAFVLAIGAEKRRSTGKVQPDEYDDRTYCVYDTDASTVYGLSAFMLVLVSQVAVNGVTRCLCFGKRVLASGASKKCAVLFFIISWLSFIVAEACLIAGSARNAYHTKYVGYYAKKDLSSCATLRKGVFAASAAMILISLISLLSYYHSYAKADTGGWVKHQNDSEVGMAEHAPEKREYGNTQAV